MLRRYVRQINNRLDETSPVVHSHTDWDHGDYKYDSSNYNYDNFEVAPIENEQTAYLSMCALANYSAGKVATLGSIDAGTVQNVNLGMVNEHKACLASVGSIMESTIEKMGYALNVRYTAEMENQGLFGGEPGQLLDLAGYLRELANQNTSELLEQIAGFGQFVGSEEFEQQGPQYDESIFSDPEKLASTYSDIRQKNPNEWTEEEKYIMMAYYDDLKSRYASAETAYYDSGAWDWGTGSSDADEAAYYTLKNEKKELEAFLKENGLMEYSSWEKGWQDIKEAGTALWDEGKDVVNAVGEGDFKGALTELSEFNTQLLATGAVVTEATTSGVLKVGEYIIDGGELLLTGAATIPIATIDFLAGTNYTDQMWDATMDDVARDKVGEAREWFYEGTPVGQFINDNSALAWDSDGATAIMNASTKAGEIVIAGAVTVATGGAGAPLVAAGLGFLEGTGQEAERRFNLTDENGNYTNRSAKDVALSYLKGVGKAGEWYMYGNVAQNLIGGAAQASTDVFTGHSARDALLNMAKKADVYVDISTSLANAGTTRLTTGEWNWKELGLDLGLSLLGNYGGELLGAIKGNKALREASLFDLPSTSQVDDVLTRADDVVDARAAENGLDDIFDLDANVPTSTSSSTKDSFWSSDEYFNRMEEQLNKGNVYRMDGRFDYDSTRLILGDGQTQVIIRKGDAALNATMPNGQTGLEYLHDHGLDPNITSFEQIMEVNGHNGLILPEGGGATSQMVIGAKGYDEIAQATGSAYYARQGIDIDAYKEVFGDSKLLEFYSTGNYSAIKEAQAQGLNIVNVTPDNFGAYTLLEESIK